MERLVGVPRNQREFGKTGSNKLIQVESVAGIPGRPREGGETVSNNEGNWRDSKQQGRQVQRLAGVIRKVEVKRRDWLGRWGDWQQQGRKVEGLAGVPRRPREGAETDSDKSMQMERVQGKVGRLTATGKVSGETARSI